MRQSAMGMPGRDSHLGDSALGGRCWLALEHYLIMGIFAVVGCLYCIVFVEEADDGALVGEEAEGGCFSLCCMVGQYTENVGR